MKKSKRIAIIVASLVAIATSSISFASAFAWFDNKLNIGLGDAVTGISNGAYFADGDGSSDHPFIINTPRHLYNLAWLQYLGYFNSNTVGPESGPVYFDIDRNLDGPLDMAGLALPPIGTSEFPFLGYFNGNGKTISNLHIDNVVEKGSPSSSHITKTPSVVKANALISGGTEDKVLKESVGGPTYSASKVVNSLGMFGVTDTIGEGDSTAHIHDFTLDSPSLSSSSNALLIGAAVGYLGSKMEDVTVKSPSFNFTNSPAALDDSLTENVSDHTLVGYAEGAFIEQTQSRTTTAQTPLVSNEVKSGAGSEFGASIPMKEVYSRLLDIHNASDPVKYNEIWDGEVGVSPETNLTKDPILSYPNQNSQANPYYFAKNAEEDSSGEEIAAYTFTKRPGVDAFMYLYGEDSGEYTQTIDGSVSVASLNAGSEFCIGDGNGNWITSTSLQPLNNANYNNTIADGEYAISSTTNLSQAIRWVYDSGRIRTSKSTRSSSEWTSTILHYGFLALDETNTLVARTGKPNDVGFPWTKQEHYETEVEMVDVGDGTQEAVETLQIFRIFMTSSQNGTLMPNGLPYTAYLVCRNGQWTVDLQDTGAHYFKYGDQYVQAHANSTLTLVDSVDDASKWYSGTNGGWMADINGTFYTLGVTTEVAGSHWLSQREYYRIGSSLKLSTSPATELAATYNKADTTDGKFRIRANVAQLITSIGAFGGDTKTDYYFYLKANSNGTVTAVTQTNTENPSAGSEFTDESNIDETQFGLSFKVESEQKLTTWETNPTYFPLSYADNGIDVSSRNTGYIVSGSNYNQSGQFPGDIRVSDYVNNANNNRLSASLGGGSSYENLTILTHEKGEGGGYVAIKDEYNSSLNSVPTQLRSVATTFKSPTGDGGLGLVRYEDSRQDLDTQFRSDFSHIHGLHFMNAQISQDSLIDIPHAHILGQDYSGYEMPQDCIDFNLKKNGFITFYAGTYFPGNNTFFSLHQIERNPDKTISSIREITKIYDNEGDNRRNKRYIYDFQSGTNMEAGDVKGDLLFDLSWVTNPAWANNAVYYFEIPVNMGEYALGSVSGKEGAYLMYLDIGSAQKNENITTVEESILTESTPSSFVKGIDFSGSSSNSPTSGGETANLAIPANTSGSYAFSYDSATSTLTCSGATLSYTHIGEGVSITGASDGRGEVEETLLKKTTVINYNDFDETLTTTITKSISTNGGAPIVTETEDIEYNILPNEYEVEVKTQERESPLIRFRYWGETAFDTHVDFENNVYTIVFDTDSPLTVYVESFTPGEGSDSYSVIFKGANEVSGIAAINGQYLTINS